LFFLSKNPRGQFDVAEMPYRALQRLTTAEIAQNGLPRSLTGQARKKKDNTMLSRAVLLLSLTVCLPGVSLAQGTQQDRDACYPDVQRHCKNSVQDQGQVLACLQKNSGRLSKGCYGVLERYGQLPPRAGSNSSAQR
jgi:hypothetical protein